METTESILGIDKDYIKDFFLGAIIGVIIVFLGKVFSFIGAIGIPLNLAISLDDIGKFLIIVIVAPVVEEIFFRQFVLSFFDDKIEKNFKIKIPFIIAALLTAIAFSLFHLATYGGSLQAAGGSFFSAMLMGVVFAYEVKVFKSVLPAIVTHAIINFSILSSLLVIFG